MSSRAVTLTQKVERGKRVEMIRDYLDLTQTEFADDFNRRAIKYGYENLLDASKVSRLESGERNLGVEEATIILEMAKDRYSLAWFVFGDRKLGSVRPRPQDRQAGAK